ncbi:MAG: glycine/sarcosine/betaine reductase selenoprotein B family protein [Acidobacteriota bacterium]
MAHLSDLKWSQRVFMKAYRYRQYDWRPGAVLAKPLAQARLALVTTAGFYAPDQAPFDDSLRGGDFSYREIPSSADLQDLRVGHKSVAFDHQGIESDKNLALPLDRLAELLKAGKLGAVNRRHFSFMGSISAPARLVSQTAPEVASLLRADGVEAVLLTPV